MNSCVYDRSLIHLSVTLKTEFSFEQYHQLIQSVVDGASWIRWHSFDPRSQTTQTISEAIHNVRVFVDSAELLPNESIAFLRPYACDSTFNELNFIQTNASGSFCTAKLVTSFSKHHIDTLFVRRMVHLEHEQYQKETACQNEQAQAQEATQEVAPQEQIRSY